MRLKIPDITPPCPICQISNKINIELELIRTHQDGWALWFSCHRCNFNRRWLVQGEFDLEEMAVSYNIRTTP